MTDTTTTASTVQAVSPITVPDSLIEQFSAIINARLETSSKETNAILERIEDNTSVLQRVKRENFTTTTIADSDKARTGLVSAVARGSFPKRSILRDPSVLTGAMARPERDAHGRFVSMASGTLPRTRKPLSEMEHPTSALGQAEKAQDRPVTARRVTREEATAAAEAATPEKQAEAKPVEPKEKGAKESAQVQTQAQAAMPSETVRDKGGRFVGKSKSQEARAEQGDKSERRSILQSLKNGFEGIGGKGKSTLASNAGTLEEAAGRAAGGPFFEAAMEIKGAKDSIKDNIADEKGTLGKAARFAKRKAGIEPATTAQVVDKSTVMPDTPPGKPQGIGYDDPIIRAIMESDKSDEERHAELVKAILKTKPDPRTAGLSTVRETGPGSSDKRRGSRSRDAKISKSTAFPKGRPKKGALSSLPGATLPGGNRPTGGGLGDLASMAMKVGPMLAALPLGAISAGIAAVGAVGTAGYSAVTGKDNFISKAAQAAGFVPKLETDASGKITGVADAGKGYTTTVDANGDVVKRTGARNWRNNNPGNLEAGEFAKSQGAIGSDGRFAVFPDYQTGRNAKEKLIFDTDKYKGKSLTDAIARYAPPGENNTPSYQTAVLAAAGGKNKKMSEYTTDERQKIMDAMEKVEGFKQGRTEVIGKVAQKPKTTEPITEGEAIREKASVTTMEAAPESIVTATATRITDARQRILSRPRARTAAMGAGNMETKPIEDATTLAEGKPSSREPITSLAASVMAKPSPPERMTMARAEAETPAGHAQVSSAGANGEGAASAPGMDRLIAMMTKMMSGKEGGGAQQIRTEFDDTMLTLMAYDRV